MHARGRSFRGRVDRIKSGEGTMQDSRKSSCAIMGITEFVTEHHGAEPITGEHSTDK